MIDTSEANGQSDILAELMVEFCKIHTYASDKNTYEDCQRYYKQMVEIAKKDPS